MTIRTIVADDHPAVRLGVRAALERTPRARFSVSAEADTATALLNLLKLAPCDFLVTDFRMPEPNQPDGLWLLRQLRACYPRLPILVLTMVDNPMVLRGLSNIGIRGLYDKQDCLSGLGQASYNLLRGATYMSPRFVTRLQEYEADHWGGNEALSTRELAVLKLLVSGMSGRDVATQLNRSEKTISRQKRCAMEKLGISHDTALMEYAAVIGLPG